MDRISDAFFDLVKISVGRQPTSFGPLSREEWAEVYDIAAKQALLGPLSVTLDKFEGESVAPLEIYLEWMYAAEIVKDMSDKAIGAGRKLYARLSGDGFRSCVLKGPAVSEYYPVPELRQSGDLDLWVEGGIEKVLPYVRSRTKTGDVFYHHCDAAAVDGIPVEVHFIPTWFNNFFRDRRLREWFGVNADAQFRNVDPELGFPVPTPAFNAVFCLLHLLRHVLFEGIGLRQFMDYYYLLLSLSDNDRRDARKVLTGFGLGRFSGAVSYVLQVVFGLEEEKMVFAPETGLGKQLLEEVMISGNFGKYDARNTTRRSDPFFKRGFGRMLRLLRCFRFCPSEVVWAPAFKLWQYLWRKKYE